MQGNGYFYIGEAAKLIGVHKIHFKNGLKKESLKNLLVEQKKISGVGKYFPKKI